MHPASAILFGGMKARACEVVRIIARGAATAPWIGWAG
jgi:hypothetical protein